MKLTIRPLSILLIFRITTSYEVHDDQTNDRWTPILRDRATRFLRTDVFIPSQEASIYFVKSSKDQSFGSGDERNRESKVSNPMGSEKYTKEDTKLGTVKKGLNNIDKNLELKLTSDQIINYVPESNNIKTLKVALTSPSSIQPLWSMSSPQYSPFLQSERGYDDPLISYSRHATNKGDATAYYPRPNDYYGTRDSHLTARDFNENIDPNSNSYEFKSNHLNSGNRTKKLEIRKGDADNTEESEPSNNNLNININTDDRTNNAKYKHTFTVNSEIENRNTKTGTDDKLQSTTAYHQIYSKSNYNTEVGQVFTNDSRNVANSFNMDSGVRYLQDKISQGKRKVEELGETFTNILGRYGLNQNDYLTNYDKSRTLKRNTLSINNNNNGYVYRPIGNNGFGYNSLNHLPVNPLVAVILSHYGHYLPGYNGRNINYRNLYSYLASNNIHNNKPFGSYKLFSDTDV